MVCRMEAHREEEETAYGELRLAGIGIMEYPKSWLVYKGKFHLEMDDD